MSNSDLITLDCMIALREMERRYVNLGLPGFDDEIEEILVRKKMELRWLVPVHRVYEHIVLDRNDKRGASKFNEWLNQSPGFGQPSQSFLDKLAKPGRFLRAVLYNPMSLTEEDARRRAMGAAGMCDSGWADDLHAVLSATPKWMLVSTVRRLPGEFEIIFREHGTRSLTLLEMAFFITCHPDVRPIGMTLLSEGKPTVKIVDRNRHRLPKEVTDYSATVPLNVPVVVYCEDA